jgi:hypothetical protein
MNEICFAKTETIPGFWEVPDMQWAIVRIAEHILIIVIMNYVWVLGNQRGWGIGDSIKGAWGCDDGLKP